MKYIISLMIVLSMFAFASCAKNIDSQEQSMSSETESEIQEQSASREMKAEYHKISQEEAKTMMDNGVLVIDVREQDEYDSGYIENAILSPVGNIHNDIANIAEDKDTPMLIYCRSGNRSKVASDVLVELGYTNVYDFGGINTWEYDIVK
jgi:phage shock protein E